MHEHFLPCPLRSPLAICLWSHKTENFRMFLCFSSNNNDGFPQHSIRISDCSIRVSRSFTRFPHLCACNNNSTHKLEFQILCVNR